MIRKNQAEEYSFCVASCYYVVCMALLLAGTLGCWEEIRYEPKESSVIAATNAGSAAKPAEQLPPVTPEQLEAPPIEEQIVEESPDEEILAKVIPERIDEEPLFDDEPEQVATDVSPTAEIVTESPATPTRTALATWRMASQWSYAAALYAKGVKPERYGEYVEQARYAAKLLDIELPDFPTDVSADDREQALIDFLTEEAGPQLKAKLLERYDQSHVALAELAVRTRLLFLVYTPKSERVEELLATLRDAARESGLPPTLTAELLKMLEERAEFKQVKAAVYQLHRDVPVAFGKVD